MIPFLKKNKDGKKPPKSTVPHTAQESIPFQRMFEDGTCRVRPGYYTRTIQYQDINYQLAQQEDKTAIFEEWCSFLNFFDSSIRKTRKQNFSPRCAADRCVCCWAALQKWEPVQMSRRFLWQCIIWM